MYIRTPAETLREYGLNGGFHAYLYQPEQRLVLYRPTRAAIPPSERT